MDTALVRWIHPLQVSYVGYCSCEMDTPSPSVWRWVLFWWYGYCCGEMDTLSPSVWRYILLLCDGYIHSECLVLDTAVMLCLCPTSPKHVGTKVLF
ncbi:hypothetical protein ElyMa_004652300 [Elysia marginata]|uniref:Uncharacterized protein n=1 Tax=Elysia marginata TaxID=1093978 RepID=A0AAV4I429_9GAST|nr:hypothetical protein ElyMa_004652300 [Elysia marginata]